MKLINKVTKINASSFVWLIQPPRPLWKKSSLCKYTSQGNCINREVDKRMKQTKELSRVLPLKWTTTMAWNVCQSCGRSFNDIWELENHIRATHYLGTRFACLRCGATFATHEERGNHTLNVHIRPYLYENLLWYRIQFYQKSKGKPHT